MSDPLGLIGSTQPVQPPINRAAPGAQPPSSGPEFKQLLQKEIARVNEMQADAREAVEDLATGRRDDLEGVILATQKADTAFRMLLQVRNKMMEAYDEVKQIRV